MSNHNIAPQPVPSSPQQYQPQQPQPQPPQPQHLHTTICGIAAVVFGALGLVLRFIPIVNNIAAILGFIGVILAIIAIVGTFRGKKRGKVLSIVAAVLSVLAIVITLAMQSAASKAIDDSIKESKGIDTSQSSSSKSAGKSSDASKSKASEQKAQGEQDLEGDIEGAHVKIVSAVKSVNDYNGKPTALVTYEWTNNTSKNNSFATLAHPNVFHQPEGYDANSYLAQAQPGTAATVTLGYVLQDDSPITVYVTSFLSTDQDTKVTHAFTLHGIARRSKLRSNANRISSACHAHGGNARYALR